MILGSWAKRLALAGMLLVVCGFGGTSWAKPSVAVTIGPLASVFRELAGDKIEVVQVLPAGASEHTFEPRPSDMVRIEASEVLFFVARNLDGWAAKLPAKRNVELLPLLPEAMKLKTEAHRHESQSEHDDGDFDPHFWLDPLAVKALLTPMTTELCVIAPESCSMVLANAESLSVRLDALHAELGQKLAPVKGKNIITLHPYLGYFVHRYGFKLLGVVARTCEKEPTPRSLKEIIDLIIALKLKAVFTTPQFPARPGELLTESAGVSVVSLDILGSSGQGYADLMRGVANAVAKAL